MIHVDVAVIQESKIVVNRRAPTFAGYVVVRKDRLMEGEVGREWEVD